MEIGRGDWALLDHLETIDMQVINLRYSTWFTVAIALFNWKVTKC